MNVQFSLQLAVLIVLATIGAGDNPRPNVAKEDVISFTWKEVDSLFKKHVDSVLNPNLRLLYKLAKNISLAPECSSALFDLVKGVRNSKKWAIEMVDASGKIPGGILEGTVMDFGSFDECLKIRVNGTSSEAFRGRYCMVRYHSPLVSPLSYRTPDGRTYLEAFGEPPEWVAEVIEKAEGYLKRVAFWFGTCVPSTCSASDIIKIFSIVAKPIAHSVSVSDCQVDEPFIWPTHIMVAVYFLSCLVGLSALGTLVDMILRFKRQNSDDVFVTPEHWTLRVFKAFSIYSNTEILLRTEAGDETLSFFHGIRFFSATWIILGHTYFFTDTWKYLKFRRLMGVTDQFNRNFPAAVIENFTIPVSSFFFMSGFLLMYTTWKKLKRTGGKLNLPLFFVHKYWRMTPALVVTIFLFLAMPLIDSGPLWNSTLGPPIETCATYWWANLLYINNWWDSGDFCLLHTWYLSALMQFHIVAILLLLLSFRWPVLGIVTGSVIAIGCFVITILITLWHDFPMPAPGMIKDMDVIEEYNSVIYIKPFAHIATYMIGIVVAYLVLRFRHLKLKWMYQALGWTLAVLFALAAVYGLYGPDEPAVLRALYIAGHRIGWALAIGWLTFACATGTGGFVQRILSWKALVPLGQLSYLTYLIHPLVIIYRNASLRERVYYGHTELVYSFLGHTVVSFGIAYFCYVIVELPFAILEGMIFRRTSSPPKITVEDLGNVCTKSVKTISP